MRKNPYLFSDEEYSFLHKVFLKEQEDTKIFKRIKNKRGVDLDKSEVRHIKTRYTKWRGSQENENQIFFVMNQRREM